MRIPPNFSIFYGIFYYKPSVLVPPFQETLIFCEIFDSKNMNERGPELGDTQFLWMKTVMIFCKGWNGVRNFWAKWIRIDSS
jgi:hypothetical protein